MQNVLIVEDDLTQLNLLSDCIKNRYPCWMIQTACNYDIAEQLLLNSVASDKPFTLLLLDIQLSKEKGDCGGFFLARLARKSPCYYRVPILFLTAISDEGAFALSEFHCYNYISKPYTAEDIIFQLEQMLVTGYLEQTLELQDINRILHRVKLEDIYYIEAQAHILLIHTKNGKICTRQYTMERLTEVLTSDFIRCHRKFIINKRYVQSFDRISQYIRINDISITVGRAYIKRVEEGL